MVLCKLIDMKKKIYKSNYFFNQKRVIKILDYDQFGIKELNNLKDVVDLPRCITLYTYEIIDDEIYLYMEYGGKNLSNIGMTDIDFIKKIFSELLLAVQELHTAGIAHLDIKLQNVLLKNDKVKLIDFEFSTKKRLVSTYQGTCFYMAPEIVHRKVYDPKKADIWALGILLYKLVFQKDIT